MREPSGARAARAARLRSLELDEIGALTRYVVNRKTREAVVERVALLTTQGRASGYTSAATSRNPPTTRFRC